MKAIYVKYNRERLPQFQTETAIFKNGEKLSVRKKAIHEHAAAHVENIYNKYLTLHDDSPLALAPAFLRDGAVWLEYIPGVAYEKLLLTSINNNDKEAFFGHVDSFLKAISTGSETFQQYRSCSAFSKVFGITLELDNVSCPPFTNVDLSFDNVICDGKDLVVIDYEWSFDFKVPISYPMYRSVVLFYYKHKHRIQDRIQLAEIWQHLGYDESLIATFSTMEINFQNYVFGGNKQFIVGRRYDKNNIAFETIVAEHAKAKEEIRQKENLIRSLQSNFSSFNEGISSLRAERLQATEQLQRLEMELAERTTRIAKLEIEQTARFFQLEQDSLEKSNRIQELEGDLARRNEQLVKLREESSERSTNIVKLEHELNRSLEQLQQRDRELADREQKLDAAVQNCADLGKSLTMSEEAVKDLEKSLYKRNHDLSELEKELAAARRLVTDLTQALSGKELETNQLRAEVHNLKLRIDDLLNSKSWKMTAPLRDVYSLLKR